MFGLKIKNIIRSEKDSDKKDEKEGDQSLWHSLEEFNCTLDRVYSNYF